MFKGNIGVLHGSVGLDDGVSIVMAQVEDVLIKNLNLTKDQIKYLVGITGLKSDRVTIHDSFYFQHHLNQIVKTSYQNGFTPVEKELLEAAIFSAKEKIASFVQENKITTILAHNTCFPLNFIMSIGLSRYLAECRERKMFTPRYVMWWHDSHLERVEYSFPHPDMKPYLLEGLPGPYVDEIVFINSQQYLIAKDYFLELDALVPGFSEHIKKNHSVIYNTSDIFIDSVLELDSPIIKEKTENFLEDFAVNERLNKAGVKFKDTIFLLQHTRMVERKKIDFALRYCFELLQFCKLNNVKKAVYFLITGTNTGNVKNSIKALYTDLIKEYQETNVFIDFVEEYPQNSSIDFLDYPLIFAHLGGLGTYFSSIEGFGNNLLEVIASGLLPVIYEYPIYKTDLKQFDFNVLSIDEFVISLELLLQTVELLQNKHLRLTLAQKNIGILKQKLSHQTMVENLKIALDIVDDEEVGLIKA